LEPGFRPARTVKKGVVGLLVTLLTLWIVPQFTRQVQDRASVRDLKADLAEQMSSAFAAFDSTSVLRAYELVQRNRADELDFSPDGEVTKPKPLVILDREEFNNAYAKWQQDINAIGAKLRAYFSSKSGVEDGWSWFSIAATRFYFLTEDTRQPTRLAGWVDELEKDVKNLNDWGDSAGIPPLLTLSASERRSLKQGQLRKESIDEFFATYNAVSLKLISAEDILIKRVLTAHATGFSTTRCDFVSTLFAQQPGKLCF
jgi:hypothetical protein